MAIRETINRKPAIAAGVAAALVLVAAGIMLLSSRNDTAKIFYTDDDGKSWFADDADRVPPFDHNGKQAYRCYVWTCDGGKTKFVSHLERFTPAAKKALEQQRARGNAKLSEGSLMADIMAGVEVKAPGTGETGWVRSGDPKAVALTQPKCPGGQASEPQRALPP